MKEQERDQFLSPDEVTNISDENKQYLLQRGYMPYLTKRGKVKWILPTQKAYRVLHGSGIEMARPASWSRIFRRHGRLISIVAVVIVMVLVGLVVMQKFM